MTLVAAKLANENVSAKIIPQGCPLNKISLVGPTNISSSAKINGKAGVKLFFPGMSLADKKEWTPSILCKKKTIVFMPISNFIKF